MEKNPTRGDEDERRQKHGVVMNGLSGSALGNASGER